MKRMVLMGAVLLSPLLVVVVAATILVSQKDYFPPEIVVSPRLAENVLARGTTRVLIRLNTPFTPEAQLRPGGVILQHKIIRYVQEIVIAALSGLPNTEIIYQYSHTPLLAVRISGESLLALQSLPGLVQRIDEQCVYHDGALCDVGSPGV